jgi:putative phosphoribosyl transferase
MSTITQSLEIPAAGVTLSADVDVPDAAAGLVLFAHGSGSGRHSPRNRYVAHELQNAGLATALADLLTPEEEQADIGGGQFRFDTGKLSVRVIALRDATVLELNRKAADLVPGEARLDVVPGATHLFEEAGALEQVASLARDWFLRHLKPLPRGERRSS